MQVEPYDEQEIGGADRIIRRINPVQHVIWDENRQCHRITTKAYDKSSGPKSGMSVDIEQLMLIDNVEPVPFVTTPVFSGSVFFTAADIRSLQLWIGYEPIEEQPHVNDNPYHGEVWLPYEAKRFAKAHKSGLANAAQWYVEIENTSLV